MKIYGFHGFFFRLTREKGDVRPWGVLVVEKADKEYYVDCMPYISIAARSGMLKEGWWRENRKAMKG